MYFSITEARGTGSPMLLAVPPYIDRSHISVYIDGLQTSAFTWVNAQTISTVAATNRLVRVIRKTSQGSRLTEYLNGQPLPGDVLDVDSKQAFYMAQEALDLASMTGNGSGAGGTPGVQLTTEGIKQLLEGQITPSLLETSLREEIGLINAPGSIPNSPAWLAAQEGLARAQALIAEAQARSDALLQEAMQRDAQITQTRETLQTEISSVATQVTSLSAGVDHNAAAIQTVESARVDDKAALAGQITTLQSQFGTDKTATNARITGIETTVATETSALALRIDTVQSQLGANENLFPGPDFDPALPKGWPASKLIPSSTAGVPAGAPGRFVLDMLDNVFNATKVPVEPSTTLDMVIWVASPVSHGVRLHAQFYDSAGVAMGSNLPVAPAGANIPAGIWYRATGSVAVPAGGVQMSLTLATDSPSVHTYWSAPNVQKRPEAFAAVEQSLNTVATRLGGVEANWTMKVQARLDGKNAIAGIGLNATASNSGPTQSQMVFLADQFTFVPSMADINVVPQPLLVMGLVNGVNTLIVPPSRYGDQLIEARMVVDGGIQARHMSITGGVGAALNQDPSCSDITAWPAAQGETPDKASQLTSVIVSDGAVGTRALQAIDSVNIVSRRFQAKAGKQYRVSANIRAVAGAGYTYLRLYFFNAAGATIGFIVNDMETGVYYEGVAISRSWTAYRATAVAPAGTVEARLSIHANWTGSGSGAITQVQDFRCEEMFDWSLIVQGGIRADRIDTRGLSIRDTAGNIILAAGSALSQNYAAPGTLNSDLVPAINSAANTAVWTGLGNVPVDSIYNDRLVPSIAQAGLTAAWGGVSGAGKPQDNATYGATFGSNVYGQITQSNVSTYIAAAAIGSAQIGYITTGNLTVTTLSNVINGNAGPGGRVEVLTNVINVYDDSNLIRCKLGRLR